jgi:hypothetical protein
MAFTLVDQVVTPSEGNDATFSRRSLTVDPRLIFGVSFYLQAI